MKNSLIFKTEYGGLKKNPKDSNSVIIKVDVLK